MLSVLMVAAGLVATAPPSAADGLKSGTGISIAVPIGKLWVEHPAAESLPVYVRRTTVTGGIIVVEVSTTPFAPPEPADGKAGSARIVLRPDQPSGW